MKLFKFYFLAIALVIGVFAKAQLTNNLSFVLPEMQKSQNPPKHKGFCSKLTWNVGAGLASYYGDLTQRANYYRQSSFSFSVGTSYPIIPHLNARLDLSFLKLHAEDSKNLDRADLRARNLSFKTTVWDLSAMIEYDLLNLKKYKFTPYAFVGFGVFYFNPYTIDASGYKQFLRYLGTEGQGLDAYPGRRLYKRFECNIPFGGGVKWAATKKLTFQLEFNYRRTNTDYIDDVSRSGYPSKALLDARNPRTATLTWRGGEVGSGPYPTNPGLNRGNPKNNDAYYTTELKVAFRL